MAISGMRLIAVVAILVVGSSSTYSSEAYLSWWERLRHFLQEWDPPTNRLQMRHHPSSEEYNIPPSADEFGRELRAIDRNNINDVHLYYFPTPSNPDYYEEIRLGDTQSLTNWDISSKTKILVHGWGQNVNATFPQNVKNAYLKRIQSTGVHMNILVLDWGRLAYQEKDGLPFYGPAVRNVKPVGDRLGQYILDLRSRGLLTPSLTSLHLVGQSLGAHVVGEAGHWIQSQKDQNGDKLMVERITGLDPAGPQFYTGLAGRQIATEDAEFVDIVHCNPGAMGIEDVGLGTAEFWVNWAPLTHLQPQCLKVGRTLTEGEGWNLCSHNYCPKFFAWSILNNLQARQCSRLDVRPRDCNGHMATFGEDVSLRERGKFFINIPENLDSMDLFMPRQN